MIKLKPGTDSAKFILEFNEANFEIMAALDLDHKTGMYGMVFFKRTELIERPSLLTRIMNWFKWA